MKEEFNLDEKIIHPIPKGFDMVYLEDVKEFIKIITEVSDENDFDIMVEDGEGGDITISFSEFIKRRAGEKIKMRKLTKNDWEEVKGISTADMKTYEGNYLMAKEMLKLANQMLLKFPKKS